jgi:putative endonuclease
VFTNPLRLISAGFKHDESADTSVEPAGETTEFPAPTTDADHLALGKLGESLASEFLEGSGYRLVMANFSSPVGRTLGGRAVSAEIDLVAYESATLCFIEVKTRRSDWFATPETNVDLRKQRQISRAATAYRRIFGLEECEYRFDVVSVIIPEMDFTIARPKIQLLRNFWTPEKFKKNEKFKKGRAAASYRPDR